MPQLEATMRGPASTGSHAPRSTLAQGAATVAGAVVFALLVPVVILLIGLPVVLVVRLLVEAVTWILTSVL